MSHERQIYLLDPQVLPPETIAVTFAKTSRSPESFREIAAELTEAQSAEFNEKWVVGYGHSSVAEHAVLHIALENISRLAVETLESNRLASYTEKSTRYQTWSSDAFFTPPELAGHPLMEEYSHTCRELFTTYQFCLEKLIDHLKRTTGRKEDEKAQQYERRIRSMAIDVCRFLLPASALANVGMTINARALEHAIGKLLSHPLMETRQIGVEIKNAAMRSVPTLLKYANEIPYLQQVCADFSAVDVPDENTKTDWCVLTEITPDPIKSLLAAALYREHHITYAQAQTWIQSASEDQKKALLHCLLGVPGSHTIPARELENTSFTFDLLADQGAYFEIKRHRMMTQIPQHLSTMFGYAIPRVIAEAGVLEDYKAAMEHAGEMYRKLEGVNPAVASYVVPNAFNRRVLIKTNLRSLVHFIRLRSAVNAHFSVRRVAQRMAEEISFRVPELAPYLGCNDQETSTSIEDTYFLTTCN